MHIFTKRPTATIADFCADFYGRSVFAPMIRGADPHLMLCRSTQKLIAQKDPEFMKVDIDALASEMLPLWLEMAGTAWSHQTRERFALAQSEFTKSYLEDAGREDLWQAMSCYNQIVAESTTYGIDPASRTGRAYITFSNSVRADVFDGYVKAGHDPEAIARVTNRLGSRKQWQKGITPHLLAIQVTRRLQYPGSEDTWTGLAATLSGYYRGAFEALAEVKLAA